MSDFCKNEWNDLCKRTRRSAEHHAEMHPGIEKEISQACETFCSLDPPKGYVELLERTSQARDMAVRWMEGKANGSEAQGTKENEKLDSTSSA